MPEPRNPEIRPLLWRPQAAADQLGISKRELYRLAAAGRVRMIRDGRKTFVPDADLVRLAESLDSAAS